MEKQAEAKLQRNREKANVCEIKDMSKFSWLFFYSPVHPFLLLFYEINIVLSLL